MQEFLSWSWEGPKALWECRQNGLQCIGTPKVHRNFENCEGQELRDGEKLFY